MFTCDTASWLGTGFVGPAPHVHEWLSWRDDVEAVRELRATYESPQSM